MLAIALLGCVPASLSSDSSKAGDSAASVTGPGIAQPPAYTIPDTEVVELRSALLQRDYQLFVALPESYRTQPDRRYPVVFVTDANYAFPLIRAIGARVGAHGKGVQEFILVGLSYAKGDTPAFSRRRDYTPTTGAPKDAEPDASGHPPVHGEAERYRRFIAQEVFPLVASSYRSDMQRKIFAGHSYGALLGTHILFAEPTMFQHYILGSPSLWFDHDVMFAREQQYAAAHSDLPADVYFGIGGYEQANAASDDPRFSAEGDMVGDMHRFERALASRRYPHLRIASDVIDGEDHLTVAPIIITRGLLRALPPQR
ncbi:alpha/beta hydrolase-fold protein [Lysobacter sp. CFH 32150]|nr:alpha/beta hydrolase-fold protein [Lysobacter sp. CFH 32150]